MKNRLSLIISLVSSFTFFTLRGQENNLVINGSFETISHTISGSGNYKKAKGISSSNNTSVDIYSQHAKSKDFSVPNNYMGTQLSHDGNNYAGIVAFYADESGLFKTNAGYQQYSEYIQLELASPLLAGQSYLVNFYLSLAERSAYAVSGLGIYFSPDKLDIKNNSYLNVTPHLIACEIVAKTDWETVSGTYVAKGGEKYLSLGCFEVCMDTVKIIPEFTNNSRKAYYYIDQVSVTPDNQQKDDLTSILYGNCFRLQELIFEPNKPDILPQSYEELKELAHFLRTYPFLVVYVDGHLDEAVENSDSLSQERALEVKKYLTAYGVNENQIKARGFGSSKPIDYLDIRNSKNDRVEITVCVTD